MEHTPSSSSRLGVLTPSIRKVIGAVLLGVEVALHTFTAPAMITTAISAGDIETKVMAGIRAPEKIVKYIADLPRNIESTRELLTLLEKPWNMEKIQGLMKAGSSEVRRLYESEKERLGHAIEGMKNYRDMPEKTLISLFIVLSVYLVLIQSVRLIRLGDRDTWLDARRKDIAHILGFQTALHALSSAQIEAQIRKLSEELGRRGQQ